MQRTRGKIVIHHRHKLIIRGVLVSLMLAFSSSVSAQKLFNFPGGVADLKIAKQSDNIPEIKYGIYQPVILEQDDHWRVIIGLSLDTLPGEYLIYIKHAAKDARAVHQKFMVRQKAYPLFDELGSNKPSNSFREHKKLSNLSYSNTQQPTLPLRFPAAGNWADFFGHITYDKQSKTVTAQNLISLSTTKLLTIHAPQNAIISKIETDTANVSSVYLDHGRGLYSVIGGVTDLSVDQGNGVVAGAVIGKLPAQSSNKEPRLLSWQCILNGVYVNPIILTQL